MSRRLLGLLFILYLTTSAFAQQGKISTVVGADWVFYGANGRATQAPLGQPQAVTLDGGSVYVADSGNHMVFKINVDGILSIVAGTGAAGFSGDSGPATAAQLNFPTDVAVDAAGNLYVTDTGNCRVRKVDTSGIITTIAGGACGYAGDSGLAVNAQLSGMYGVAVDSTANRLYIADTGNNVIRMVDLVGGVISTVAGTGVAGYNGDNQPATAAQLNTPIRAIPFGSILYIAEYNRIRAVSGGIISTVAGTGVAGYNGDNQLATLAQLNTAWGMAVDGAGRLYIADGGNNRLRKIDTGGIITTIAGTGAPGFAGDGLPAINAQVNYPQSPWVDATGVVYFADTANMRVRRILLDGSISTIAGSGTFRFGGDGGPAIDAFLYSPLQIGVITNALIIADAGNYRLRKVDASTLTITTIAGDGVHADRGDGGSALQASFMVPFGVVGDDFGNIWVSDRGASRVRKIDTLGNISAVAGTGVAGYNGDGTPATNYQLNQPYGLAGQGTSQLYIADRFNRRVRMVTSGGTISTVAGNGQGTYNGDNQPAISAALNNPSSVALDRNGNMYIAERNGHRVRKVDPGGIITTFAGTGVAGFSGDGGPATNAQLNTPGTVAVDAHNNVYIADWVNARIRVVNTDGTIATLTGTGTPGFSGDGGPAALAAIGTSVAGMIFDDADNLYFSDSGNHRIRKIEGAAAPGFLLAVTPVSPTAGMWQQATYSVKIVPLNGFSSTVFLTCGGSTLGLNCAFSPGSTISPGQTVTMAVTAGASAPRGPSSFTVVGTSGSLTSEAPASITVASGCGAATKTWTGGTSGAWETAANWSGGVLPTSTDSVCIAGAATVAVSGSASAGGLYSDGLLDITGTLGVSGAGFGESWVKNLNLSGTLSGTGEVWVGNIMQWTAGSMSGNTTTQILAGASLLISGSADKYLHGRNLRNFGTITWMGNGAIHTDQGATITNMAQSVFSAQNNSGFVYDPGNGAALTFVNYGAFIKSGVGTTTSFGASTTFYNYGQIALPEGTLDIASITQDTPGTFALLGGDLRVGAMDIAGGMLQGSGTITGNVTNRSLLYPGVPLGTGTLSIAGNYTQTSTGSMIIDLSIGPAQKLAVSGAVSLAGALTVAPAGAPPFPGDTFNVMTYGSVTGSFTTVTDPVGFARVFGAHVLSLVYGGPAGTTCTYLASGPVSWWKGDGNGANAAGGPAASLLGGVGFYSGPLGTAFSLNGTSAYLSVPDSPLWAFGQADFSIALWVDFNSLPSNYSLQFPDAIFAGNNEGSGNLNKWVFGLGNGNLFFHTNSPSAGPRYFAQTSFSPVLGRWYHLVVTRKAGHGYSMYVNGVLLASEMNFDPVPDAAAPLTIGQTENLGFLNGYLAQVQIYRRALGANEIQGVYNSGSYGVCPGAYNPSLDFSSSANPNGFWSYGYSTTLAGPFTLLTAPISMATGLAGYSLGGVRPSIQGNSTNSPITYASAVTIPPQGLELHPGPNGEYAIVRWVAPVAGVYVANGFFASLNSSGATTDVHVRVRNDMRFDSTVNGNSTGFGLSFAMNAGDPLDFLVGWGSNATNLNDSTQLSVDMANISASHPAPSVSTLTPSNATAGTAGFTLTVDGGNFEPGSVVRWNGSDRTTTFVNATRLTAQISMADIASPGLYDVTVYTPGVGGSGPSTFTVSGTGTNPLPVLTSLSSSSIPAGSTGLTLTVSGNSFVGGAAVLWNGSPRPTTFVSANQLQATISSSDLLAGGEFPVQVQNPAPGGGASSSLTFYVTAYARGLNLLINPNAEGGPGAPTGTESVFVPGWTLSGPFTVVSYGTTGAPHGDFISPTDPGPSLRGTRFFAGGANASTSNAIQVIDISPDASAIDAGQVAYYLGGYLGGLSNQGDSSQLSATFKDASGYPLAGVILGLVTPADRSSLTGLLPRSRTGRVPAGTRKVQVTLLMNLVADSYIDGYADNLAFGVHSAYIVGDSFPYETSSAGAFGDGRLDNVDLIQAFRAATNPTLRPPTCSDRFDAMDAYPLDNSSRVGGDNTIDNMDLITILDRVVRLDTSTPVRSGMIAGSERDVRCMNRAAPELMARPGGGTAAWSGGPRQAGLEFGSPAALPGNVWRVPVYLRAPTALDLAGFSMSLGVRGHGGSLNFIPGEAGPPSLVDSGLPGQVGVGWLSGLRVDDGQRLLLGYVEIRGSSEARALRVIGVVANRRSDKRLVPIAAPALREELF